MTDKDFETILPIVTAGAVARIAELNGWDEDKAIERFFRSRVYAYLSDEETKVWHYSPLLLAELFNDERAGHLLLPEV